MLDRAPGIVFTWAPTDAQRYRSEHDQAGAGVDGDRSARIRFVDDGVDIDTRTGEESGAGVAFSGPFTVDGGGRSAVGRRARPHRGDRGRVSHRMLDRPAQSR
jgi:hypothetical protein